MIYLIFILLLNSLNASIEIPTSVLDNQIVKHSYFTLSYNEHHEQADWIAYKLTKSMVMNGSVKRKDNFKVDKSISTGSSNLSDYKGSGYDRGHLCPAADMKISKDAMNETFYMSNMSPQHPSFNRGIWKKIESQVRAWAVENEQVYVVTGGVLNHDIIDSIGGNKVSVPRYFYKVILDYYGDEIKGIGFIIENKRNTASIKKFAVSIDYVESFTGIDFFPSIPDEIENKIEESISLKKWGLLE